MNKTSILLKIIDKKYFKTYTQLKFLAGILKFENCENEFIEYESEHDNKEIWKEAKGNQYTIETLKYLAIKSNISEYMEKIENNSITDSTLAEIIKHEFIIGINNYIFNGLQLVAEITTKSNNFS